MYEMYPDTWGAGGAERSRAESGAQPRRRARKEHSVVPPILVRREQADPAVPPAS